MVTWTGVKATVLKVLRRIEGPVAQIKTVGKNTPLNAYNVSYYERASALQPGVKIKKVAGEEAAVRAIDISSLAEKPVLLHLGRAYTIGLYSVKKGNQTLLVVHDTQHTMGAGPGPGDYYVLAEGKQLPVGRNISRQDGLLIATSELTSTVSGRHLIITHEPGKVYIIDQSRNGTSTVNVLDYFVHKKSPDLIPAEIKPSEI